METDTNQEVQEEEGAIVLGFGLDKLIANYKINIYDSYK
jgi:hypothetical protein